MGNILTKDEQYTWWRLCGRAPSYNTAVWSLDERGADTDHIWDYYMDIMCPPFAIRTNTQMRPAMFNWFPMCMYLPCVVVDNYHIYKRKLEVVDLDIVAQSDNLYDHKDNMSNIARINNYVPIYNCGQIAPYYDRLRDGLYANIRYQQHSKLFVLRMRAMNWMEYYWALTTSDRIVQRAIARRIYDVVSVISRYIDTTMAYMYANPLQIETYAATHTRLKSIDTCMKRYCDAGLQISNIRNVYHTIKIKIMDDIALARKQYAWLNEYDASILKYVGKCIPPTTDGIDDLVYWQTYYTHIYIVDKNTIECAQDDYIDMANIPDGYYPPALAILRYYCIKTQFIEAFCNAVTDIELSAEFTNEIHKGLKYILEKTEGTVLWYRNRADTARQTEEMLKTQVEKANNTLATRTNENEDLSSKVSVYARDMAKQKQTITNCENTVAEQQQTITNCEKTMAEQQQNIDKCWHVVAEKKRTITNHENTLDKQSRTITNYENTLDKQSRDYNDLKSTLLPVKTCIELYRKYNNLLLDGDDLYDDIIKLRKSTGYNAYDNRDISQYAPVKYSNTKIRDEKGHPTEDYKQMVEDQIRRLQERNNALQAIYTKLNDKPVVVNSVYVDDDKSAYVPRLNVKESRGSRCSIL